MNLISELVAALERVLAAEDAYFTAASHEDKTAYVEELDRAEAKARAIIKKANAALQAQEERRWTTN